MPSFPDSVKVFTTKLDGAGNPINAAHVNDLQDEVNAIESGYLDGSARLNSSLSTLAALSVSGGTTLAGSLSVAAGTSLAGTLQSSNSTVNTLSVSSNSTFAYRPTMPPPDFALVFLETAYTHGSSGESTASFTGQAAISNSSMHSTATNPSRLTPQSTGIYEIYMQIGMSSASAAGFRQPTIRDSSGTVIGRNLVAQSVTEMYLQASAYKRFDVLGGFVTCGLNQSGGSLTISTGITATWFSMKKL